MESSKFNIDVTKEATAWALMWKILKTPNVFTIETSYYGYKEKNSNILIEFNPNSLTNYGTNIVQSIH
jgi:hypothetical protein